MTDGRSDYVTLRSTDGGKTWPLESLQVLGSHQGLERLLESGLGSGRSGRAARLDLTGISALLPVSDSHRYEISILVTFSTRETEGKPGRART